MMLSRPFAIIAALAIVAGMGVMMATHTAVQPAQPGEQVVYFKLTCREGQLGVHRTKYWIYEAYIALGLGYALVAWI